MTNGSSDARDIEYQALLKYKDWLGCDDRFKKKVAESKEGWERPNPDSLGGMLKRKVVRKFQSCMLVAEQYERPAVAWIAASLKWKTNIYFRVGSAWKTSANRNPPWHPKPEQCREGYEWRWEIYGFGPYWVECRMKEITGGHFSGVPAGDQGAIKRRYRELCSRWHPDREGGDAGVMAAINVEYGRLGAA